MNIKSKKKRNIIIVVVCAACVMAVLSFTVFSKTPKNDAPGDNIEAKDLVGMWKVVSANNNGNVTTGESNIYELNFAYHWAEFNDDGTGTISYAPEQGKEGIDVPVTYEVKDNRITFKNEELFDLTGKVVGGKLILTRDGGDAPMTECTFEKQT